jgi:hypothetical protein
MWILHRSSKEKSLSPSARARARLGFAVALSIALETIAHAQALHCGRTIVVPGDAQADVLRKCGPPTSRQSATGGAKASGSASRAALAKRSGGRGGGRGREIWIYDLGSRQLVRVLTFERGRLTGIDFAGYGGR